MTDEFKEANIAGMQSAQNIAVGEPTQADTMKSLLAQTAGAVDEISNSLQVICQSLGDCTPNVTKTVSEDGDNDTQTPTSMDQMRDLRSKAQDTQLVADRIRQRLGAD